MRKIGKVILFNSANYISVKFINILKSILVNDVKEGYIKVFGNPTDLPDEWKIIDYLLSLSKYFPHSAAYERNKNLAEKFGTNHRRLIMK